MEIALIFAAEFKDYELLKLKLNELGVTKIISGISIGYEIIEKYQQEYPNVQIAKAESSKIQRTYNAIKKVDNVVVFTNGTGHLNKSRTNLAIKDALKKSKKLYIYPYKESAFSIEKENEYIKIDFKKRVKDAFNTNGIYLNKEETVKMIERLQKALEE